MASGSFSEDIPFAGSESTPENIVLHVLCPSLPPPNRFTFNELSLSTTVAALKVRISQSIPNQPPPETQRLIFRGKPLSNDGMTLQALLEPVNESEYSMHLVLPPAPSPAVTASRFSSATPRNSNGTPMEQNPLLSSRFAPPNYTQNAQGIRYRGAVPSPVASEAEIGLALQRNIEALRRQIELQERGGHIGQQEAATTTSSSLFASNPLLPSFGQQHAQHPSSTITSTHFSMPPDTSGSSSSIRDQNASVNLSRDYRLRLQILRQQIALGEDQLNRGIAPPIDHIIRIRTQLFQLLDDLYRSPLSERDGSIESLLTRVFNIYTRADQVRVTRSRSPGTLQNSIPYPPADLEHTRAPLYLLSSPDGYQALVSPPGTAETIQTSLNALRATQTPATTNANAHGHGLDMHPNPDAVVMENAVRQAALNPRVVNNEQGGLGRHFRRLWLFIRLYFFCYMFSEPGTWTRVFFVALAVIISLLSETSIPQQLYGMTIAPVQRHLEGLVHFPPDEHPQPRPHATGSAAGPAASNRPGGPGPAHGTFPTQLRHNFRRVERSLALFIASLVPGVGERHIEARNAAEVARNAELAREEEERRRQDEANNAEVNTEHQQQNQEEDGASARPELTEQHSTTGNEFSATIPREDENGAR